VTAKKNVFVIESFIQEIRSKMLTHPVMKQVKSLVIEPFIQQVSYSYNSFRLIFCSFPVYT